jgi:MCP family monocarboxylic acid transporter-like MFS transporter 10
VLTYVSVTATRIGIPSDFAFYFVAIGNASSLFGRFAAGKLSDIIGMLLTLAAQALIFLARC